MATSSTSREVKAGDVVRLKSGGAVMTAERVNHAVPVPYTNCSWMDARDNIHRAFINLDALERVDPEGQMSNTP